MSEGDIPLILRLRSVRITLVWIWLRNS